MAMPSTSPSLEPVKCGMVPLLGTPNVALPGLALRHATKCTNGWACRHQNRGPVRAGTFDRFDRDKTVAACPVLDNDRSVQGPSEMLRQDPAKPVPAAARSKWINDLGQRPGLGERCASLRGQRQTGASSHETSAIHACAPRQMICATTPD